MEPIGQFQNPLSSDYQVAEYHMTEYDNENQPPYPNHFPYLFKKIYDHSGKTVTEIDCSFDSEHNFYELTNSGFYHEFKVVQHGQTVYLINKQLPKSNIPDTVARITLNLYGRPESCSANAELTPDIARDPSPIIQHYFYRNNMVTAVKSDFTNQVTTNTYLDSLHYDNNGNLMSFNGNSFQYDYTRTAKQQFYCHGYMGLQEPFYLLQYLGYFPEVNSPTNVMIHIDNVYDDWAGALTNHKFDREGRLISYNWPGGASLFGDLPLTITWK